MTRHKYQPPSGWDDDDVPRPVGDRESKSDRFKRVFEEELQQPPRKHSLVVRMISGFVFGLLGVILIGTLVGVVIAVFTWISGMLQ